MKNIIEYKNKKVEMPSSWNDFKPKQFLKISKRYYPVLSNTDKEKQSDVFYLSKMLILKELLKMNWFTFMKLTDEQIASMLPCLDFMEDKIDLNKQLLPKFRIKLKTFYGPEAKLINSDFNEFIQADTYFLNASKGQSDEMYKLAAVLYRPKSKILSQKKKDINFNGDIREDYSTLMFKKRTEYFKQHLPEHVKWAIFFFYWGFRNTNVIVIENIFQKPNKAGKRVGDDLGWIDTLFEMSGDIFGDMKNTGKTQWYTVLVQVSRKIRDAKKRNPKK